MKLVRTIKCDNVLLPRSIDQTVPDYLRTKLDLDLEAKQRDLYETASLQPVQEAVSDSSDTHTM